MSHSTGGATTGGWNIWSNGYIATTATLAAGPTTLTVNAMGSVAAGTFPHMVVSVGGKTVGTASVQATSWTAYPFAFTATAGAQEIRVTFDNDAVSGNEDRNLYVENVVMSCGASAPPPPPACVPTTCAAAKLDCGSVSDGCGGALACGTCTAPSTCGGAGVANVCGSAALRRNGAHHATR
jgi:phage tail tape-measure protein